MTREELARILEQFAICAIHTGTNIDLTTEEQYRIIAIGIDTIVDTVMMVNDRKRIVTPSIN